ncbi:MAG TPA: V-type ATP synthase subunit F [Defluviitaleaceae bacterium]|jgi:V/A-type H+-transporting ATPase subunit F|nr:ATP synthase subunit F [Candidatus Epulonipiscium sp.]HOQ16820.1 V-type ATP synthase subunit F [Defluviitaleaceae bacterium]HPT75705.1 V-type ATP synthase subunit F [Defluviitaleaceae bacterium]HQD50915.1 V-type ATP synthase subunit F [Defluviitaleaceae bacterium]
MKSYLISDNKDTLVGLQLAGIKGIVVSEKEEVLREIDKVLQDQETGILIVTELIMEMAREELMELKMKRRYPLIVEIPDRHGFRKKENLLDYINEAIGVGK